MEIMIEMLGIKDPEVFFYELHAIRNHVNR